MQSFFMFLNIVTSDITFLDGFFHFHMLLVHVVSLSNDLNHFPDFFT